MNSSEKTDFYFKEDDEKIVIVRTSEIRKSNLEKLRPVFRDNFYLVLFWVEKDDSSTVFEFRGGDAQNVFKILRDKKRTIIEIEERSEANNPLQDFPLCSAPLPKKLYLVQNHDDDLPEMRKCRNERN